MLCLSGLSVYLSQDWLAGLGIVLLWATLYRTRLVPRALAGAGIVASVLQVTGVPVRGILGYTPNTWMAVPLAPAYLTLAGWLIVKGFTGRQPSAAGAASPARQ